jgi:uncharacterized protein (DUF1800 family)
VLVTDAEISTEVESDAEPAAEKAGAEHIVALLAALGLAACGPTENSPSTPPASGTPTPTPAPTPTPTPTPNPTPTPTPLVPATNAAAARFLLHAQFSASESDISALTSRGYVDWLNTQYSAPLGQTGVSWLNERGHDSITAEQKYFWDQFGDFMIWNQLLVGPDQMRKRVALALSEFFVVSLNPIDGFYPPYMIAAYWDLLTANAFGNFRTLLEKITLNAAMGFYLNTKGNLNEDASTGRQPDENYAREVMQLFSIGLHELNNDGTRKLDANGSPIETYTQSDILNLARVFTGYDYDYSRVTQTTVPWHSYKVLSTEFAIDPMRFTAANHSTLPKSFLGTTIPGNTPGPDALRIALDVLFRHPNTPPFFSRQMIQRLVTSNPSPAYVERVANAFRDDGTGVRGNLRAVWTAILTDAEARNLPAVDNALAGKLREPVVRFVQWARTVGIESTNGAFEIYSLASSDNGLGQSPLRSPSVFNFFRPGYVPPNTAMATQGKQAPEFQLHNETTTAGYINFLYWMIRWGYGDVRATYATLLPIAHDVPAVVARLNLQLSAEQLSGGTLTRIQAALSALGVTANSSQDEKLNLLASACLLILSCPEYLVQK